MIRLALFLLLLAAPALAQEPQTRAEELAREREEKAKMPDPPEPGGLERFLLALENDRLFERILNPPEGFYPKLGNISPGSGFSFGPAYRKPGVIGDFAHFTTFAALSFKSYWMIDARLEMPELADGRAFATVYARRYDFPEEAFFGVGPDSLRENETPYGLKSTDVGGVAGVRVKPWLLFSSTLDYMTPEVTLLPEQPDFIRTGVAAEINTRQPRANPRQGVLYGLSYTRYDDRDGPRFDFHRVEADVQHYINLYKNRRVLAVRGFASVSDADDGSEVPLYLQRTLGGAYDLRGFRQFRFRDRNQILFQAEYRWEIFTAMDGALFYDAGKVAPRIEDLNFRDLESDYGIGFRFGTSKGVFLRVEGAFGSREGKHFVMRYGHVF